jgi:hypothetical protein
VHTSKLLSNQAGNQTLTLHAYSCLILAAVFRAFNQPEVAAFIHRAMCDASKTFRGKSRILIGVRECHVTSFATDQSCM